MAKKKIANALREISIDYESSDMFVGMIVRKRETVSTCVDVYVDDSKTVTVWECKHIPSGKVRTKLTLLPLRITDLPATEKAFENHGI